MPQFPPPAPPATVYLAVKTPDGKTTEIGHVYAIPPDGSKVTFEAKSYSVRHAEWEISTQAPKLVHVTITLG